MSDVSVKLVTVNPLSTVPAESSGADYNKGQGINAVEYDQNMINLRAMVQRMGSALGLGAWFAGLSNKATPVGADSIPLVDSAASNQLKYSTLTNLLSFFSAKAGPGSGQAFATGALTASGNITTLSNTLTIGSQTGNINTIINMVGSNTQTNWQMITDYASNAWCLTPSTATGGVTFTTPALTVNASGSITIPGTLSSGAHTVSGAVSIAQGGSHNFITDGTGWIWTSTGLSGGTIKGGIYTNGGLLSMFGGATPAAQVNVDTSGNLLAGVTGGSQHTFTKSVAEGVSVFAAYGNGAAPQVSLQVFATNGTGVSAAATSVLTQKNSSTGRSINAAGTINASGADYAEYELKSATCGAVAKGQIIGFDANGQVTDQWANAVSFGVKSTSPNLVGGDTWGNEDAIGKRPEQPVYEAPAYAGAPDPGAEPTELVLTLPAQLVQQEGEEDTTFTVRTAQWQEACAAQQAAHTVAEAAYQTALAAWQTAKTQFTADQATYQVAVTAAEAAHTAAMATYQTSLAAFEVALETERQKVDRIAYSGKVPCNSEPGAFVGGYVIAVEGNAGSLAGKIITKDQMKADMTQYLDAVGRIRRILADGRPEIAVIIH